MNDVVCWLDMQYAWRMAIHHFVYFFAFLKLRSVHFVART